MICRRCNRSVTFIDAGLQERLFRAAGLQDPPGRRQALTVVMECPDCAPAYPVSDGGSPAGARFRRHAHAIEESESLQL
jgi:hypothetical protein